MIKNINVSLVFFQCMMSEVTTVFGEPIKRAALKFLLPFKGKVVKPRLSGKE